MINFLFSSSCFDSLEELNTCLSTGGKPFDHASRLARYYSMLLLACTFLETLREVIMRVHSSGRIKLTRNTSRTLLHMLVTRTGQYMACFCASYRHVYLSQVFKLVNLALRLSMNVLRNIFQNLRIKSMFFCTFINLHFTYFIIFYLNAISLVAK